MNLLVLHEKIWQFLVDPEIRRRTDESIEWLRVNFGFFFDALNEIFALLVSTFADLLTGIPLLWLWAIIILICLLAGGWKLGLFAFLGWGLIWRMELWTQTMDTLALVLASGVICTVVGVPLGISMARSNLVKQMTRPVLDFLQTMPAFVYLIPAILFFDLGAPAGLLATVFFAFPPIVRLVAHGIEQVDHELVEASDAFGANGWQTLSRVQVPLAMPSIMVGVNQMLMLSLSMAVIAAMVGYPGLGAVVMTGISRLEAGIGFEGGLGIVILAITLDRVTQALGHRDYEETEGGFFSQAVDSVKRAFSSLGGSKHVEAKDASGGK